MLCHPQRTLPHGDPESRAGTQDSSGSGPDLSHKGNPYPTAPAILSLPLPNPPLMARPSAPTPLGLLLAALHVAF